MTAVSEFVNLCLRQTGDAYVYGVEVSPSNPDPTAFDCSELVQWACDRLGVAPEMPDGSWAQLTHCLDYGLGVSVDEGITTYGALLFMGPGGDEHVAVSLGNGHTIEARGRAYGVGSWGALGRPWSAAGRIPGLVYDGPGSALRPNEEDDMVRLFTFQGGAYVGVFGAWKRHIANPGILMMMERSGFVWNTTDGTREVQPDVFGSMLDVDTLAVK